MNLNDFQVPEEKADGVWLEFDDAQFLIGYAHSKTFNKVSARVGKKYPQHRLNANPELIVPFTNEILADAVLLDWKNVNEGGTPLPCTRENKLKLLAIGPFREWLSNESRDLTNYKAEALAEDADKVKSRR